MIHTTLYTKYISAQNPKEKKKTKTKTKRKTYKQMTWKKVEKM